MKLDLDALEAKARAATPGRRLIADTTSPSDDSIMGWVGYDHGIALADAKGAPKRVFLTLNPNYRSRADVEFIAATSPDVVLVLVARLRAAEQAIHGWRNGRGELNGKAFNEWLALGGGS